MRIIKSLTQVLAFKVVYLIPIFLERTQAISQEDYYKLSDHLFTSYKKQLRPTVNFEPTEVFVKFYLLSIQNLDEKAQVLETAIELQMMWRDEYLTWDLESFGGIDYILYPQKHLWVPDIVVYNSVKRQAQLGYDDLKMVLYYDGIVEWLVSEVAHTSCDIDVTYYPFDEQNCSIVLSTWTSFHSDIKLNISEEAQHKWNEALDRTTPRTAFLNRYTPSGTWKILEVSFDEIPAEEERTRVRFTMKIQRKRTYYILNILLPVLFLSLTASMVFLLPAEAGEKMGVSITVLLAYAVYLTIIADNMPQTSLQVSVLACYLTALLGATALGVVMSAVVLFIHHKSEDSPVGDRMAKVTRVLRKLFRIRTVADGERTKQISSRSTTSERLNTSSLNEQNEVRGNSGPNKQNDLFKISDAVSPMSNNHRASVSNPATSQSDIVSIYNDDEIITWVKVAETLDRVLFFASGVYVVAVTIVFFTILTVGGS